MTERVDNFFCRVNSSTLEDFFRNVQGYTSGRKRTFIDIKWWVPNLATLYAKTPHIWRPYKLALLYLYSSWIIPVTNFTHIQSSFLDRDPAGLFMMQGQRVGPFCVGTFYCHHNWASLSVFRGVSRIISGGLVTCATKYPNRPLRNQNQTFGSIPHFPCQRHTTLEIA